MVYVSVNANAKTATQRTLQLVLADSIRVQCGSTVVGTSMVTIIAYISEVRHVMWRAFSHFYQKLGGFTCFHMSERYKFWG